MTPGSPTIEKIVVIGAGQAGFSVTSKLRALGYTGKLSLVGDEDHAPYQRPPLSKGYLLGEITAERLYFRPHEFYREQNIDLHLSVSAERIDREARRVELTDGTSIAYDRLVLTTGSTPIRLPEAIGGALEGVHTVRTLVDVDRMAPAFKSARSVLVVGGGYIGLEAAAVAAKLGMQVTLVEAAERILRRVASVETSAYFRALHAGNGVTIIESVSLSSLNGKDGNVVSATLSDGKELAVDCVIVGIGIRPNQALAEAAGLTVENGIVVDEFCRTSDPDIYAAGDCAVFPHRGARLRLESVGNALSQGEAVAHNIVGDPLAYDAKPWFWSDQFSTKLQISGLSSGFDRVVIRGGEGQAISHWYYKGDGLIAVDAMNDPRAYMVAKRLIDAGKTADPAIVADVTADLKELLK